MKAFIFLHLLILQVYVFAQVKTENAVSSAKGLSIGLNYSSDFCYRTLKNNDGSATTEVLMHNRNGVEMPKYGYTTGFVISCGIDKHFEIESGIQYSNKGYASSNYSSLIFPSQVDPTKGIVIPTPESVKPISEIKYLFSHHCIDVPIRVIFNYGEKG